MANNYTRAVMIDIETLDTKSSAVVIQIAAVVFDYNTKGNIKIVAEFDEVLPITNQLNNKRTIDKSTMTWWMSDLGRLNVYSGILKRISNLEPRLNDWDLLHDFRGWVGAYLVKEFWFQGPTFDAIILENVGGGVAPWRYYQVRDLRTVQNFVGHDEKSKAMKKAGNNHNALDDCHSQIKLLQYFIKKANKNG